MKTHANVSRRQEALAERNLAAALLTLRSVEECRAFFRDLCTPAELQAMADRWAVVECLHRGLRLTTIGRVARYLAQGAGGYQLALGRLGKNTHG